MDGIDVGQSKSRIFWRGLARSIHEGVKAISNIKEIVYNEWIACDFLIIIITIMFIKFQGIPLEM